MLRVGAGAEDISFSNLSEVEGGYRNGFNSLISAQVNRNAQDVHTNGREGFRHGAFLPQFIFEHRGEIVHF